MPGQTLLTLMCFPLLLPRVHLQHFRVSLATVSPLGRGRFLGGPGCAGCTWITAGTVSRKE